VCFRASESEDVDNHSSHTGAQLGLGDFVLYSVLVGLVGVQGDWPITLATFLSLQIGLCVTLCAVAVCERPVPALPVSIFLAMAVHFATSFLLSTLFRQLSASQIFV